MILVAGTLCGAVKPETQSVVCGQDALRLRRVTTPERGNQAILVDGELLYKDGKFRI